MRVLIFTFAAFWFFFATFTAHADERDGVIAWGGNQFQQSDVPANLPNVTSVSAAYGHSLALTEEGKVSAWGGNTSGETSVPEGLENVIAISAGASHNLALQVDGTVLAWGNNRFGQAVVPEELTNQSSEVTKIAAAGHSNLALKSDGTLVFWGYDPERLQDEGPLYPLRPPAGLIEVVDISARNNHLMALKSNGQVIEWGQLLDYETPGSLTDITAIAAGQFHSLALKADGTVIAWGDNPNGQATVPEDLGDVIAIAAGHSHNLALKSDGTIVAWGWDVYGQATPPADLEQVLGIAAGAFHSLAISKKEVFEVTFLRGDHGTIESGDPVQWVESGDPAIPPIITPDAYWNFVGWDVDISNITQQTIAEATYEFGLPPNAPIYFTGPFDSSIETPSSLKASFRLIDANGRGINVPNDVVISQEFFNFEEDGKALPRAESFLQIGKFDEIETEIKTVILIDNSFSLAQNLSDIKVAAKEIVNGRSDQQIFAIYSFSDSPVLVQEFTSDVSVLESAIESIAVGSPTTNLYGALIEGLSRWNDTNTLEKVTRGLVVVLTDGVDRSSNETLENVITARMNKQIYTVEIGEEPNTVVLEEIGNSGNFHSESISGLIANFDYLSTEVENYANSFYGFNYISPKRGIGSHEITLAITDNQGSGPNSTHSISFDSETFSDEMPAILINSGPSTPGGLQSISLKSPDSKTFKARTRLGIVESNYSWTLSDPAIAEITMIANDEVTLVPLTQGNTTLTITDLPNADFIANVFAKEIPLVVE